jgi:hypothetical protein
LPAFRLALAAKDARRLSAAALEHRLDRCWSNGAGAMVKGTATAALLRKIKCNFISSMCALGKHSWIRICALEVTFPYTSMLAGVEFRGPW